MDAVARIGFLRRIAWIEGISYLLLLGVAMPLRTFAQLPLAVTIGGWIHGALFMVFALALAGVLGLGWSIWRMAAVFVSALLPFGMLVADPHLQRWQDAHRRG